MRRNGIIIKCLAVVLAVAIPLLLSSPSFAESGCHKSSGGTSISGPKK